MEFLFLNLLSLQILSNQMLPKKNSKIVLGYNIKIIVTYSYKIQKNLLILKSLIVMVVKI
jgi:hypothetical protein